MELRLTQLNRSNGIMNINLLDINYQIDVEEEYFSWIKSMPYTQIKLKIANDLFDILLPEEVINHFGKKYFKTLENFNSCKDFYLFCIIDLLIDEIKQQYNTDIELITLEEIELTPKIIDSKFIKINLFILDQHISNKTPSLYMLIDNKYQDIINKFTHNRLIQKNTNLTPIFGLTQRISFPLILAKTSLTINEINSINLGDLIILEQSCITNLTEINSPEVMIDVGKHTLIVSINNTNATIRNII